MPIGNDVPFKSVAASVKRRCINNSLSEVFALRNSLYNVADDT